MCSLMCDKCNASYSQFLNRRINCCKSDTRNTINFLYLLHKLTYYLFLKKKLMYYLSQKSKSNIHFYIFRIYQSNLWPYNVCKGYVIIFLTSSSHHACLVENKCTICCKFHIVIHLFNSICS